MCQNSDRYGIQKGGQYFDLQMSYENSAWVWCFLSYRVCNFKCSSAKQIDPNFNFFNLEVKQIWRWWCLPCNHWWLMTNRQLSFTETNCARLRTLVNGQQLWLLVTRHVLCYQCSCYHTGWSADHVAARKIWIHYMHTYIRTYIPRIHKYVTKKIGCRTIHKRTKYRHYPTSYITLPRKGLRKYNSSFTNYNECSDPIPIEVVGCVTK